MSSEAMRTKSFSVAYHAHLRSLFAIARSLASTPTMVRIVVDNCRSLALTRVSSTIEANISKDSILTNTNKKKEISAINFIAKIGTCFE